MQNNSDTPLDMDPTNASTDGARRTTTSDALVASLLSEGKITRAELDSLISLIKSDVHKATNGAVTLLVLGQVSIKQTVLLPSYSHLKSRVRNLRHCGAARDHSFLRSNRRSDTEGSARVQGLS